MRFSDDELAMLLCRRRSLSLDIADEKPVSSSTATAVAGIGTNDCDSAWDCMRDVRYIDSIGVFDNLSGPL